ncbi:MAG: hypothetical protein J5379_03865 [Clostridiales bacterium]|nr:hypothetical protein [Clostridiales bacterium]
MKARKTEFVHEKLVKILAVLLAAGVMLAGCSNSETTKSKKTKSNSKSKTKNTSVQEEEAEEEPGNENAGSTEDTYRIEAALWSADVPNHFKCIKDDCTDTEEECYFAFYGDPAHPDYDYFIIAIKTEDADAFRKEYQYYFSLSDFAEGKLPTTNIDGYEFVEFTKAHFGTEIDITEKCYVYRHEEASMTVSITFGDWTAEGSFEGWSFFDHFDLLLPDLGLSDPPYSFESGEHQTQVKEMPLGEYTVTPVQVHFSEHVYITSSGGVVPFSSTASHAAASAKYLYTFDIRSKILYVYRINEEEMTLVTSAEVGRAAGTIDLLDGDSVTFYPDMNSYTDDRFFLVETVDEKDTILSCMYDVVVSPDQQMIFCYNPRGDMIHILHYDPNTKSVASQPFTLDVPLDNFELNGVYITETGLYVQVREYTNDSHERVFEYDRNGNLIRELSKDGQEDLYFETMYDFQDQLLVTDAWEDTIELWDKEGNFISEVHLNDLLGFSQGEVEFPHYMFLKTGDSGDFILIYAYDNGGVLEDLVFRIHIA